jgi:hypothetical protein
MLSTITKNAGMRTSKWSRDKSEASSCTSRDGYCFALLFRLLVGVVILLQFGCGQFLEGTNDTTSGTADVPAENGVAGGSENSSIDTTDSNNGNGNGTEVEVETSEESEIIVAGSEGPPDVLYKLITQGDCRGAAEEASALIESGDEAEVVEGYLGRPSRVLALAKPRTLKRICSSQRRAESI